MVRLSTLAVSTLVPALKVLSTVLPDSTFFSLVRTNGRTLAGLDVLELDDRPELAVDVENHAVLQVVRGCHTRVQPSSGCGTWVGSGQV